MSNYPPRLAAREIRYIALEGGGGKGNAFVGALESLAHPDLNIIRNSGYRLTNIRGVSGASAGAITALFLAAGFTPIEIKTISELEDFNAFFDGSHPGRVFRIGGFQDITSADPVTVAAVQFIQEALALWRDLDVRRMAAYVARRVRPGDLLRAFQELAALVADLPSAAVTDPLEALRRIQAALERLQRLGLEDVVRAITAIQEILHAIPVVVWNHAVQLVFLWNRLVTLRVGREALALLFAQINAFVSVVRPLLPDATFQQLLNRDLQDTATAIVQDFGILTGEEIYKFFRRWLAVARLRVNNPTRYQQYLTAAGNDIPACFTGLKGTAESGADAELTRYRDENLTFEAFEREFGIKLVLAGSNLETFKSHLFSPSTTPRFYVVDAVRLSMALPYCIFKPLIIRREDGALPQVLASGESPSERNPVSNAREDHPLVGVWVDGGLFNNFPSHVFDRDPRGGETLGLRLDSSQDLPAQVNTIVDYFGRFPGGILFGAGETLASRSYDDKYRTITLDTGDLGLLSFSPTPAQAAAVRRSAIEYVFRYFDTPVPASL